MLRSTVSKVMWGERTTVLVVGLAVMMALLMALLLAPPAHAASFTVTNTNNSGAGSLRQAILDANTNNNPGVQDQINFDIPGSGVQTISPTSLLPFITQRVTIDGYTQRPCSSNPAPCSSPNTLAKGTNAKLLIELSGANLSGANQFGLFFQTPNSVVKGLVINRFGDEGIILSTNSANTSVEGNFIGTNPAGTQDLGNGNESPADSGVAIASTAGTNNFIGGGSPAARNLISGNQLHGVEINGPGNRVVNNLIGTAKDGTSPIENSIDGVRIASANNSVGGLSFGEANTIAFNGSDGVLIASGTTNRVLSNSIFSNDGLGIDLLGEGPTPNDPQDPDTGPNELQNKPVLTSAVSSSGSTTIKGRLNSTPNETFTIQFFSNPPGTEEGKTFLGKKSVTTGSDGLVRFRKKVSPAVKAGREITATATDSGGNTSEFSARETVQ